MPEMLIREEVNLETGVQILQGMDKDQGSGIAVITQRPNHTAP